MLAFITTMQATLNSAEKSENINSYVHDLDYNPDTLLKYAFKTKVEKPKKEGTLEGSTFIILSHNKKHVTSNKHQLSVDHKNLHYIYPSSLLLANNRLIDGPADALNFERKPIILFLDILGVSEKLSFRIVPHFANYRIALDKFLRNWFRNYSETTHDIKPISQNWQRCLVSNQDQLKVKFGRNLEDYFFIDFDAVEKGAKTIVISEFRQIYFSVHTQVTSLVSDLFAESVSVENLIEKNVNSDNPPVIVDSLSYGRLVYQVVSTTNTSSEAREILEHDKKTLFKQLENLEIAIYTLSGGMGQSVDRLDAADPWAINSVIAAHPKFGQQLNFGYPIRYTAEFLKDHKRVIVHRDAEYIKTTKEIYRGGTIRLTHDGGYVAQFYVSWDEIGFDDKGDEIRTRRYWYKNGHDLTAGFSEVQQLRGNSRNITVKAWVCTFLSWEWWRMIFEEIDVRLIPSREFRIVGTSLQANVEIKPPIV